MLFFLSKKSQVLFSLFSSKLTCNVNKVLQGGCSYIQWNFIIKGYQKHHISTNQVIKTFLMQQVYNLNPNSSYPKTKHFRRKKERAGLMLKREMYLYEYFKMPDTEAKPSLFWWLHQVEHELLWGFGDLEVAMELVRETLKLMLVFNPFVRIGIVVKLGSFADWLRWALFLYHLMPTCMR